MTNKTKIYIGIGIIGYILYRSVKVYGAGMSGKNEPFFPFLNPKPNTIDPNNPRTPQKPYMPQVVVSPYSEGGALQPRSIRVELFEFVKDYQSDPNQATTRMISWNFVKGQKIKGISDYSKCAIGGGVCPVLTTTKGELQGKQNQMYWITIPQGYLKLAS